MWSTQQVNAEHLQPEIDFDREGITWYQIVRCIRKFIPDKADPFARRGRKAAGLLEKMAELPKEKPPAGSAFLFERELRIMKKARNDRWRR